MEKQEAAFVRSHFFYSWKVDQRNPDIRSMRVDKKYHESADMNKIFFSGRICVVWRLRQWLRAPLTKLRRESEIQQEVRSPSDRLLSRP